jgi:hypothetical protein
MEALSMRDGNFKSQEQEMLEEYGWFVHYVFETDKNELKGLANIHTHGILENFNHLDVQIVLPLSPEVAHPVLVEVVEKIKNGTTFKDNEVSSEVLYDMDVYFLKFNEGNREVLRVMLPDPKGSLPNERECDEMYKRQLEII